MQAFRCASDSDCPYGPCNIFKNQCVILDNNTLLEYNRQFVACLVNSSSLPPFVLGSIMNATGLSYNSIDWKNQDYLVSAILKGFSQESCGSIYTFDPSVFDTWIYHTTCDDECVKITGYPPTFLFPFVGDLLPPACTLPSNCGTSNLVIHLPQFCNLSYSCSLMNTSVDQCESIGSLCVVCEDPLSCLPVPAVGGQFNTSSDCNGRDVCVTHDKDLVFDVSEADCVTKKEYGGCYYWDESELKFTLDPFCIDCDSSSCLSSLKCYADYLVPSQSGLCLVTINQYSPRDIKSCASYGEKLGGYTGWKTLQGSVCVTSARTQQECLKLPPGPQNLSRWVPKVSACSDFQVCYTDFRDPSYLGNGSWVSFKDSESCSNCDGKFVNYFSMAKRKWQSGVPRKSVWHLPTILPSTSRMQMLNHPSLGLTINQALQKYQDVGQKNFAICNVYTTSIILVKSLCTSQHHSGPL
eukprot:TRINITY_DN16097_c0_g1_i12.p1 TRINITY_DN16097_c0_g1~~TRINITY_DN16097_c0_g1_i12.p1  ORF type:complete len:467 (+),score=75.29 TRINITY_DN16097_c0_g1_i12:296-1696(+)